MLGNEEVGEEEKQESDPIVENPDSIRDVHTMVAGEIADDPTETSIPHGLDPQVLQLMRRTNKVLRAMYEGLEAEYDEAEIILDEDAMYTFQNQMDEVMLLMYNIEMCEEKIHGPFAW